MNRFFFYLGVAFCLLNSVLTSCTERIELDVLTQAPKLVVYGFISDTPDSYCIELSRTGAFFGKLDSSKLVVSGATVTINGVVLDEKPQNSGKYYTSSRFTAHAGGLYCLRVEVDFDGDGAEEVYESSTVMPAKLPLDSVNVVPNIMPMFGQTAITVSFNYFFQPKLNTYPGGSFKFMGKPYVDRITRHLLSPFGKITDTHYVSGFPFFMIRPDFFTDLKNDTILFNPGGYLEIGLRSYSPELFEFLHAASVELSPGNPLFSGPPANVPSNISNGAYGCFGAYSEVTTDEFLPWGEQYFQGKWYERATGMVIEVIGDQAIVVERGVRTDFSKGDIFLKKIRVEKDSSVGSCMIKERSGFTDDKINWNTYFHFRFTYNGGKWVRL